MKKNRLYFGILLVCAVVTVAMYLIFGTPMFLNLRVKHTISKQIDILQKGEVSLTDFSRAITDACCQYKCNASFDRNTGKITTYLGNNGKAISLESRVALSQTQGIEAFDRIKGYYDGYYFYPAESCVFQTTIWHHDEVYCWVSLVHNDRWKKLLTEEKYIACVESGEVIPVDSAWCVMIEYGY